MGGAKWLKVHTTTILTGMIQIMTVTTTTITRKRQLEEQLFSSSS